MTEALQQLMPQIQRLSPTDRDDLLEMLLTMKEPADDPAEVEAAWKAVIDRRTDEIHSGKAVGKPAEQMFEELRKQFP